MADNVDRIGTIIPSIGPIRTYTGTNPNIDLSDVTYDPKSSQLRVKWTASDIITTLEARVEAKGKELEVHLHEGGPTMQRPGGGFEISAGGAAITPHDDTIQLPRVAKGTVIKVINGDVIAGTFTV